MAYKRQSFDFAAYRRTIDADPVSGPQMTPLAKAAVFVFACFFGPWVFLAFWLTGMLVLHWLGLIR